MLSDNDSTSSSSWEQVIACSHPTQPTRYYRGYALHYPTPSEATAMTIVQNLLATWNTSTGVTLIVQDPLLSVTDHLTIELSASSLDFDTLLRLDTELRAEVRQCPDAQLEPATLQLFDALSAASANAGNQTPTTTLTIIDGLQAVAFDLIPSPIGHAAPRPQ